MRDEERGSETRPAQAGTLPVATVLFDLDQTLITRGATYRGRLASFLYAAVLERLGTGAARGRGPLTHLRRALVWSVRQLHDHLACRVVLQPQARRLLALLDRAALPYGIVTNGSAQKRHTIHLLGLDRRTTCVLISGEQGRRKPDTSLFLQAADCLGVSPQRILFVGDQRRQDMQGAHESGMRTALLRRGQGHGIARAGGDADVTLSSLLDLVDVLGLSGS